MPLVRNSGPGSQVAPCPVGAASEETVLSTLQAPCPGARLPRVAEPTALVLPVSGKFWSVRLASSPRMTCPELGTGGAPSGPELQPEPRVRSQHTARILRSNRTRGHSKGPSTLTEPGTRSGHGVPALAGLPCHPAYPGKAIPRRQARERRVTALLDS